jgi:hypothetical protein
MLAYFVVDENRTEALRLSFGDGPIVDDQGTRLLEEVEVGRFRGLVVHIMFDEHPPPHFCVKYQGEKANFSIESGCRLHNNKGLERFDRNIKKWWQINKSYLIEKWNETRPTDCQVGLIRT